MLCPINPIIWDLSTRGLACPPPWGGEEGEEGEEEGRVEREQEDGVEEEDRVQGVEGKDW